MNSFEIAQRVVAQPAVVIDRRVQHSRRLFRLREGDAGQLREAGIRLHADRRLQVVNAPETSRQMADYYRSGGPLPIDQIYQRLGSFLFNSFPNQDKFKVARVHIDAPSDRYPQRRVWAKLSDPQQVLREQHDQSLAFLETLTDQPATPYRSLSARILIGYAAQDFDPAGQELLEERMPDHALLRRPYPSPSANQLREALQSQV